MSGVYDGRPRNVGTVRPVSLDKALRRLSGHVQSLATLERFS